jgi:ClpP class serine protease
LFAVTTGIGSIGVVFGGIVSDKFVGQMGVKSRVAVLAISQVSTHTLVLLSAAIRKSVI